MKLYQVIYERYYDDFGSGGKSIKGNWLYQSEENAIKKIVEIKSKIYERFKEELKDEELLKHVEVIDTPNYYTIRDNSNMCYWGESVYITEKETDD